ncbi:hypothetical protein FDECE_1239 [Fusarium decemcellulare]|nr:hypothetical protein FDECE_1239 [Fusarium decemcellulare]
MQPTSDKRPRPAEPVTSEQLKKIPCKRCRARKVKCDGEFPSCLGCTKASVPCFVADLSAPRDYTRVEMQQLESKIHRIEALLASTPRTTDATHETPSSVVSPRYVGPESGVGFFLSTLEACRRRSHPISGSLLLQQHKPPSTIYHAPHPFPPFQFATQAIQEYFREFHLAHPFLNEAKVQESLNRHISLAISSDQAEKHQLFQLNMVLAIGSVHLFRQGITNLHPFGFFTAALEASPPSSSSFSTLEDIENLLLIARFGGFYNIGCSLWDLGRLCIRIAIELNLHRQQPTSTVEDSENHQRRLKVFWDSYLLDRLSSSTLGRPFAIQDFAVEASLPRSGDKSHGDQGGDLGPFNWLIRLGQITSRIHCSMTARSTDAPESRFQKRTNRSVSGNGEMYSLVRRFHSELAGLRRNAPSSNNPTSMYEAEDFFELSYQERRMWLLRVTMERLSSNAPNQTRIFLRPCLQAACGIIRSFERLKDANLVTFTRTHMHLVFIASLVVVAIMHDSSSSQCPAPSGTSTVDLEFWLSDLDDGSCGNPQTNCEEVLRKARGILRWLANGMPDVAIYARLFESLEQDLARVNRRNHHPQDTGIDAEDNTNAVLRYQQTSGSGHPQSGRGPSSWDQSFERLDNNLDIVQPFPASDNTNMLFLQHGSFEGMSRGSTDFQASHNIMWPLSDFLGTDGLDLDMSNFVWDMALPWETSPSVP